MIRSREDFPRLVTCFILEPMSTEIHELDRVVLLETIETTHCLTGERIRLRPGQEGTVVLDHGPDAKEVEFSDATGRAYALQALPTTQLLRLHHAPELVEG